MTAMLEALAWSAPLLLVGVPLLLGRFPAERVLERARRTTRAGGSGWARARANRA